jgi:hypothetical protein
MQGKGVMETFWLLGRAADGGMELEEDSAGLKHLRQQQPIDLADPNKFESTTAGDSDGAPLYSVYKKRNSHNVS